MLSKPLKSKINKLWEKFWSGGIANPITAIEQISYLLFMKRLDEIDTKKVRDAEFSGEKYKSIFKGKFEIPGTGSDNKKPDTIDKSKLRWSHFKQMEPEEMLNHISTKVFPFIKQLNSEHEPFTRHMTNAVFMIPKPSLLDEAVKNIDEVYDEIKKQSDSGQEFQDTQGDVYEYLLNELALAGKNGQFRTPRHIIQLICELVDPDINDRICDPTCGTGGFLIGAYQHILTKHTTKKYLKTDENGFQRGTIGDKIKTQKAWDKLKRHTFFGFDFDTTMVRIGLMNLMLHDITRPKIEYMDTLSKRYDEYEGEGKYTVVLANPPFKGSIDKGDIGKLRVTSTKTELLFVDRIMKMLENGGRAGVIIPNGVLFGSGKQYRQVKERLLKDCQLEAIIAMPSGVFKPYAGVSTAVLIFTKAENDAKSFHTKKVWYYEMKNDGYSLDDHRKKLKENPLPDIVKDFQNIVKAEKEDKDRAAQHFYVPLKEIQENDYDLSINRYKALDYQEEEYDPPKELLAKVIKMEEEIMKEMDELNSLIQ